ncbi:MAG: SPOR domain-containing protein [Sphingomonas sp.]
MPETWTEPPVRDEDRLPWLETADQDYRGGPSLIRTLLLVILGLAVVAAVIYGVHLYKTRRGVDGNGALITAPEGEYKVKPDNPGGMNVTGEGDSAIATSDGAGAGNAAIDLKAVPESPVTGTKAAPAALPNGTNKAVAPVPATGGKLAAKAATPNVAMNGNSGSSLVQLGSFPDEAEANVAWTKASKRFSYLAPLGKSVQKAEVNGRTVYRLRVNAGSAGSANELCGKLKVAGEACFIPQD